MNVKKATPIYKSVWFWVIVAVAFVALGMNKQNDEVPEVDLVDTPAASTPATPTPAAPVPAATSPAVKPAG